jgi:protein translocase SecG subunit
VVTIWYSLSDMEIIQSVLPYAQIVLSILLTASILLQQRGSNLGGAFGGDNFSAAFHKRRGAELFLFRATAVLAVLLVASALLALAI